MSNSQLKNPHLENFAIHFSNDAEEKSAEGYENFVKKTIAPKISRLIFQKCREKVSEQNGNISPTMPKKDTQILSKNSSPENFTINFPKMPRKMEHELFHF
jgi:hypothetical protein